MISCRKLAKSCSFSLSSFPRKKEKNQSASMEGGGCLRFKNSNLLQLLGTKMRRDSWNVDASQVDTQSNQSDAGVVPSFAKRTKSSPTLTHSQQLNVEVGRRDHSILRHCTFVRGHDLHIMPVAAIPIFLPSFTSKET
ncbi:hypothetical protein TcWFU_008540 [Taenia crassiceps]|uniref:Uncharacterized protein n=1 Tax=Taenia crassiceps TaxID=6207 RepID=A0ABR4Q4I5_9CEST